jgi:hypothetical protein
MYCNGGSTGWAEGWYEKSWIRFVYGTLTLEEVIEMNDVLMSNGEIFSGEEIGKLTKQIISVFAEKKMSVDKSKIILKRVSELLGEYSVVEFTDF